MRNRETESLPTVERKLQQYVSFATSGQAGPLGVIPRVLVTVPTAVPHDSGAACDREFAAAGRENC